jgi:hypothetical protein
MNVYMDISHHRTWDDTLSEVHEFDPPGASSSPPSAAAAARGRGGRLALSVQAGVKLLYQAFHAPWPMRDRDLLLRRTRTICHRSQVVPRAPPAPNPSALLRPSPSHERLLIHR